MDNVRYRTVSSPPRLAPGALQLLGGGHNLAPDCGGTAPSRPCEVVSAPLRTPGRLVPVLVDHQLCGSVDIGIVAHGFPAGG